jgi:Tol biopolymer transport system component/predicted Ser/Thr protein kinase
MGEVWRGKDTRLGRDVAIKILPAEFAENAQLRARFDREAKTISALSHPNICTLFDVGEGFLVMEFLEGESLAERLQRGPLPLSEVLRHGQQIASALDAAHRKGIVHRDLKPGNIMLTKSGAKLLDFGLARSSQGAGAISGLTNAQTAAAPLTAEGSIVGTLQYMAPEQLEGLEPDARTDIFALGAVLYEMATGKRAFEGATKTSLIAAIVSSEPRAMTELVPLTPPALEHVVRKCLAKDPDQRWQSAADVAGELQWIRETTASGTRPVESVRSADNRWKRAIPWLAALVLLAAGILAGTWIARAMRKEAPAAKLRGSIALPAGTQLAGWASPAVAISPDGSVIAFVAQAEGKQNLYLRRLDEFEARLVEGSDGAEGPFFSPDGQWVAFGAGGISGRSTEPRALKKVLIAGGPAQVLTPVRDYFGGSWGDDGYLYYVNNQADGLWRIAASGGTGERIGPKPTDPLPMVFPRMLPGSAAALVVAYDSGIAYPSIFDTATGKLSPLGVQGTYATLMNDRTLLYVRDDGVLLAAPFSMEDRRIVGGAVPVLTNVALTNIAGAVFAVSESGTAVFVQGYVRGSGREVRRIVHLDQQGKITPLPFEPGELLYLTGSPDRSRLAVSTSRGEVFIYDLQRNTRMKLAESGVSFLAAPVWSPDGRHIAFHGEAKNSSPMYLQSADGSGPARMLVKPKINGEYFPASFTPDSRSIVYYAVGDSPDYPDWQVFLTPIDDPSAARKLFNGYGGQISPDGTKIAYESTESGRLDVYLQSFPDTGNKVLISTKGGKGPSWSKDGRTLYYWQDNDLMAVDVGTTVGVPRRLFTSPELAFKEWRRIPPLVPVENGFLTLALEPGSGVQTHLNIATGWAEEVEGKVK